MNYKRTKQGFTLIELLVVVLIIGILAAVALPQYQKAVRKARVVEAKVLLKAIGDASEVYFWGHRNWRDEGFSLDDLDLNVPLETKDWDIYIDECLGKGCAYAASPKFETGYTIYYTNQKYDDDDPEGNGKLLCVPDDVNSAQDHALCKSIGGIPPTKEGYYGYTLP